MQHPLALFAYCPRCGHVHFSVHDARAKRCENCGFTFYHNASAATVACIFNAAGDILVTRRAFDPAKGTLDLPGGFVDPGESIEEGLVREVAEETGAQIKAAHYLFSLPNTYVYSDFTVHTADAFFACELVDESVVAAHDDAAALFWCPLSQLQPEAFGLTSIRHGVERLLKERGEKSR